MQEGRAGPDKGCDSEGSLPAASPPRPRGGVQEGRRPFARNGRMRRQGHGALLSRTAAVIPCSHSRVMRTVRGRDQPRIRVSAGRRFGHARRRSSSRGVIRVCERLHENSCLQYAERKATAIQDTDLNDWYVFTFGYMISELSLPQQLDIQMKEIHRKMHTHDSHLIIQSDHYQVSRGLLGKAKHSWEAKWMMENGQQAVILT